MVGHTPTEQLSGTLFQKTKARQRAKLACVITFLDFVFSFPCMYVYNLVGLLVPCIYIFKGKQILTEKVIYMSNLGPARSIV